MLVTKRRTNESILVGEATITVHKIKGESVTLTIDAPRHVKIYRSELLTKILEDENEARNGE